MTTLRMYTATEARKRFSDVFDEARYGAPVVVKKGNSAVAVIPFEMLARFEELEAELDRLRAHKEIVLKGKEQRKTLAELRKELRNG